MDSRTRDEIQRLDSHGAGNILVAGDASRCRRCGQAWDTNDFSPPWCTGQGRLARLARKLFPWLRQERAQRPADDEADQTYPSGSPRPPREGRPL